MYYLSLILATGYTSPIKCTGKYFFSFIKTSCSTEIELLTTCILNFARECQAALQRSIPIYIPPDYESLHSPIPLPESFKKCFNSNIQSEEQKIICTLKHQKDFSKYLSGKAPFHLNCQFILLISDLLISPCFLMTPPSFRSQSEKWSSMQSFSLPK